MGNRLRTGKAYEHIILGMMTQQQFDVYQPLVDDQGIDGLIRFYDKKANSLRYYELQIKGVKTWSNIRCKIKRMSKKGVLIFYCASKREFVWFLYEELSKFFSSTNLNWGDVHLIKEMIDNFMAQGRGDWNVLIKKL